MLAAEWDCYPFNEPGHPSWVNAGVVVRGKNGNGTVNGLILEIFKQLYNPYAHILD